MTPSLYLIVLTWNSKDLIVECLESLFKVKYDNLHIVVVDNDSKDGTSDFLRSEYGNKINLIRMNHNSMFAGGNNAGIKFAQSKNADYIMLVNDDTVIHEDMVTELIKVAESDPTIGAVGPKIYYFDPDDQIWFAGGKVHLARGTAEHIGIREKDSGQYDEVRDVDYITGCGLMVKSHVIEEVGNLDRSYPLYFEDADWCMRIKNAGYRRVYVPKAKMWHKISASSGGQLSKFKILNKLRSSLIFFARYSKWYHIFTIPFFQLLESIRIIRLVGSGKIKDTK
jgi:GT2 family glycosyltransferase